MEYLAQLKKGLQLAVAKTNKPHASAVAISGSGQMYVAGSIASDTNLLDISAEQAALCLAMQASDFEISQLISLYEQPQTGALILPIRLQVLIDFVRRTNKTLGWTIVDTKGKQLFQTNDVRSLASWYQPETITLKRVVGAERSANTALKPKNIDPVSFLKQQAVLALGKNFPTYDGTSAYGAAVLTKTGISYCSAQYSSFDHRTNLHAEMAAVVAALMAEDSTITDLALVSTKYPHSPCPTCGCCLQFLSEISARYSLDLTLHMCALENDAHSSGKISDYLLTNWSSKQW